MAALNFDSIFQKYKDSMEKTWAHDRSKTVGASEIFGCLLKGWFEKHKKDSGFDPDSQEETWGAALRGDILEEHYVVPALQEGIDDKYKLLMAGSNQVTLIDGLNSATPDGLLVGLERDALADYGIPDIRSNCIMIEIKTIDPRVIMDEEKQIHHGQCQQQMGIIRSKTKWRPYYAVILYVDASFLDNIKVFVIPYSEEKFKVAKIRSDIIMNEDDPAQIRPEGKLTEKGCSFCKWTKACAQVQLIKIPDDNRDDLDEEDQNTFADKIQELKNLEADKKDIDNEIKEIKQEIKDDLLRLDRRFVNIDIEGVKFEARWSKQKGRKSFQKKLAEEAGLDLEPYMKEGDPIETFRTSIKT